MTTREWEHGADRLADVMAPVARPGERMNTDAATPEQVDLVAALSALQHVLAEHCRRVITGEPVFWAGLGDLLEMSAHHCYHQAQPELSDQPARAEGHLPHLQREEGALQRIRPVE